MPVARTANDGAQQWSSGYTVAAGLRGPVTKTNGAAGRARRKKLVAERNIHTAVRVYASRNR